MKTCPNPSCNNRLLVNERFCMTCQRDISFYETPVDKEKRKRRNRNARERHWRNTGVSSNTIDWMKQTGWL